MSSLCWRCLSIASRPQVRRHFQEKSRTFPDIPALAFSTTPYLRATPPKKSSNVKVTPKKGVKALFLKKSKKPTENRGRRPAPGERKALRKRIVLSNVNALQVNGMQDITAENMYDGRLQGQVLGLPGPIVDQLRAVEAFKSSQGWGMFWRPGTLMRDESLEMGKLIADMSSEEGRRRKTVRTIVVGEKGSGKSMMLLQAMTMAMLKGWTVINLPEAQDITIGHTPYAPLPNSSPPTYIQPAYYARLLQQISTANPHLSSIPLSQSHSSSSTTLPIPIPPKISLSRLASLGASDPEIAYPIFTLLLTDILAPGRPPVFLGLDGLAHAMQSHSGYTAPTMKAIHPHDLDVLNWYCGFLSGAKSLPNGGIVMAATSQSNAPKVAALDMALSQLEGGYGTPAGQRVEPQERNPFLRYDERVLDVLLGGKEVKTDGKEATSKEGKKKHIQVQRLQGLSRAETRGLVEYWARSGMVRERVDERFLGEKWALSGGGVVGELERAVVRMRV